MTRLGFLTARHMGSGRSYCLFGGKYRLGDQFARRRDKSAIDQVHTPFRVQMNDQFGRPYGQAAIGLLEPIMAPVQGIAFPATQDQFGGRVVKSQLGAVVIEEGPHFQLVLLRCRRRIFRLRHHPASCLLLPYFHLPWRADRSHLDFRALFCGNR
ncbi:MAG: hypothetical protein A2075_13235 [Geobacteraceae bacterium GWC2_58_44]|nr:MAG: hypothetical protein A2075_13235 [Geobacteraceae bacterium GWC2_58_44]